MKMRELFQRFTNLTFHVFLQMASYHVSFYYDCINSSLSYQFFNTNNVLLEHSSKAGKRNNI